jgi:hypothetical protein
MRRGGEERRERKQASGKNTHAGRLKGYILTKEQGGSGK